MEFGAGAGSSSGGDPFESSGGGDRKKKRYHRHTPHQTQRLEAKFRECPHPDEKTRTQLSRELGLNPKQIKFWFQNRRTQQKAQHERADNSALRSENDKIRCENIAIREALKNVICPSCGGPPVTEDSYFDEQKLRIENSHLKEELDRVSSIAAKYIGRPISQLPPVQPINISSLDLSMASFGSHGVHGLSLDLDLLPDSSSGVIPNLPFAQTTLSDMDKSHMAEMVASAMDELIKLSQSNEPLWIKSKADGREILNFETYGNVFMRNHPKNANVRIEASRSSGVTILNGLALVDMFMDANKWAELFPTIVSNARTIEVVSSGILGNPSGTLLLMHEELQVLSALIPTRPLYFLRFCQQIEQETWAIVDVSYDIQNQESQFSSSKALKLPSGCLIQDMPNGYSKVTWVEHWEVEDRNPIHNLYENLVQSGLAFGAERWISTLQRTCERLGSLMVAGNENQDVGGVIPSPEGKRSMMKLAQRMVTDFCSIISPCNGQQWTTRSGLDEFEVRATLRRAVDPGQPNGVVLSAATTIWLPISPENVFNFLRDERTRPRWDVLSSQNPVQEVAHISNGSHPGNCISVLRASNTSQNNMLILQESCIDSSGSLVVYSPVDLPSINIAMSGEDPSYILLLPSGFAISPDGHSDQSNEGASTSGPATSGSLITVVLQILMSNLPVARMTPESVDTVNNLIGNTVRQIKTALSCN